MCQNDTFENKCSLDVVGLFSPMNSQENVPVDRYSKISQEVILHFP